MRLSVVVSSAVLVLLAAAGPTLADNYPHPGKIRKPVAGYKDDAKPNYSYAYGIKDKYSGVKLDVKEDRKGDRTRGEYTSLLPDGRVQRVTYHVDGNSGFMANVHYKGVAKHPLPAKKHVKPTKFVSFRPHEPLPLLHKPLPLPHEPLPHVPPPVRDIHLDYGGGDDDDGYVSLYGQGFPKRAPFQGHVQHDFYPGQRYGQHGPAFKSYDQGQFNSGAHRLFQQQYPH